MRPPQAIVGPAVTIRPSAAPRRAVRSRRCIVRPPELGRSGWAGRVGSADATTLEWVPGRRIWNADDVLLGVLGSDTFSATGDSSPEPRCRKPGYWRPRWA